VRTFVASSGEEDGGACGIDGGEAGGTCGNEAGGACGIDGGEAGGACGIEAGGTCGIDGGEAGGTCGIEAGGGGEAASGVGVSGAEDVVEIQAAIVHNPTQTTPQASTSVFNSHVSNGPVPCGATVA